MGKSFLFQFIIFALWGVVFYLAGMFFLDSFPKKNESEEEESKGEEIKGEDENDLWQ